jgi:hypothetical protein
MRALRRLLAKLVSRRNGVTIYCGIDWFEHHHEVAVIDAAGSLLGRRRIGHDRPA